MTVKLVWFMKQCQSRIQWTGMIPNMTTVWVDEVLSTFDHPGRTTAIPGFWNPRLYQPLSPILYSRSI